MSAYRIELTPDDNGTFLVTCPALPGVVSFGEDDADCIAHGRDAVGEWIADSIARGLDVPIDDGSAPTEAGRVLWVTLAALTELKVELYRSLRGAGITRAELARRLDWNRNSVDRLFHLDHASRLDQIEAAAAALGKQLRAEIVAREAI
jgi:antitoxin HicB